MVTEHDLSRDPADHVRQIVDQSDEEVEAKDLVTTLLQCHQRPTLARTTSLSTEAGAQPVRGRRLARFHDHDVTPTVEHHRGEVLDRVVDDAGLAGIACRLEGAVDLTAGYTKSSSTSRTRARPARAASHAGLMPTSARPGPTASTSSAMVVARRATAASISGSTRRAIPAGPASS